MIRLILVLVWNVVLCFVWPFTVLRRVRAAGRTGWIELVLDGPVVDLRRAPKRLANLLGGRRKDGVSTHRLQEAIDLFTADSRVVGLFVTLRSLGGGAASLRSLREQLERARARGKRLVVFLEQGASLRELYLASVADEVWMDPAAHIAPLGVAVSVPYVRDGLDRIGVTADVVARGRYKTAAEGFARGSMSEPQREQLGALVDELFEEQVEALAEGRRIDPAIAHEWVEGSPWSARMALERGIVDALVTEQELERRLSGEEKTSAAVKRTNSVGVGTYMRRRRFRFLPLVRPPYLAVVDVHGAIVSQAQTASAVAAEDEIVRLLERVRRDRRARGLLLHVESRGGSALASARIARAVQRLRETKPVVAYFADVAASGGYMIGVAAEKIVAQPTTITGSIGVIAAKPVLSELLQKVGIRFEVVKRGSRADMFSLARPFEEAERAAFERELESVYDDFVKMVAAGRRRDEAEIRAVAEGRVWSGRAALQHGLVDRLGGFREALDELRSAVGKGAERMQPKRLEGRALRSVPLRVPRLRAWVGAPVFDLPPALGEHLSLLEDGAAGSVWAYCGVASPDRAG